MERIIQFLIGSKEPDYEDKLPSPISLTCRALVGGYLLYLMYGLLDGVKNPTDQTMLIVMIIAIVVFTVAGGLLLYVSLRDYARGRFIGGKLDLGERPKESNEDEEIIDSEIKED